MTKISNGQESVFGPRDMVAISGVGSSSGDWGSLRRGQGQGDRGVRGWVVLVAMSL